MAVAVGQRRGSAPPRPPLSPASSMGPLGAWFRQQDGATSGCSCETVALRRWRATPPPGTTGYSGTDQRVALHWSYGPAHPPARQIHTARSWVRDLVAATLDVTVSSHNRPSMGVHGSFRNEARFVWAWDQEAGGLVRMVDGDADRWRPRCESGELICPVGGCPSPKITSRREHLRQGRPIAAGFVHRTAPLPGHEPESIAHIASKLLLKQWLEDIGCDDVATERYDTQRRRRPDVTAVTPTGQKIAFEVQFAAIAAHHWRRRHEDLRAGGYESIWLWGHDGTPLVDKTLEAVHRQVVADGDRLWWIDPDTERIGCGVEHWQLPLGPIVAVNPTGGSSTLSVAWHPIGEHRCTDTITHPYLDQLDAATSTLRTESLASLATLLDQRRRQLEHRSTLASWQPDQQRHATGAARGRLPVDWDSSWRRYYRRTDDGPTGESGEVPPPHVVGRARADWWNLHAARKRQPKPG